MLALAVGQSCQSTAPGSSFGFLLLHCPTKERLVRRIFQSYQELKETLEGESIGGKGQLPKC